MSEPDIQAPTEEMQAEDILGLTPEFVQQVAEAIGAGRADEAKALVEPLHYSDMADLLERLSPDERASLLEWVGRDLEPEVLTELDEAVHEDVVEELGVATVAAAVTEMESDDAVHVVEQLEDEEKKAVLDALTPEDRAAIEKALSYPESSAGRLMARELVAMPSHWTVGQAVDHLRENHEFPEDFYDIYVVDGEGRPVGKVPLNRMVRTQRPIRLADILDAEAASVPATMDQEEVAFLFRQQDIVSASVVDEQGRLVGVITIDDVVDVIDEEAAEDMLKLAGVTETDIYRDVIETVKARGSWLAVNLATAFLAAAVIGIFEGTLQKIVALAVLMPIVASMGGNAGTQTLAVAVRGLAMKEIAAANAFRVISKEVLVGLSNGVIFAIATGLVAWAWFDMPKIGLVIGMAMVVNLLAAGLFGILIPLALERLRIDPAVASSVFLTTVTDVVGFFAFLGLATLLLL